MCRGASDPVLPERGRRERNFGRGLVQRRRELPRALNHELIQRRRPAWVASFSFTVRGHDHQAPYARTAGSPTGPRPGPRPGNHVRDHVRDHVRMPRGPRAAETWCLSAPALVQLRTNVLELGVAVPEVGVQRGREACSREGLFAQLAPPIASSRSHLGSGRRTSCARRFACRPSRSRNGPTSRKGTPSRIASGH